MYSEKDVTPFSEYLLPLNFRQTNYEYEIELYVLDKNTWNQMTTFKHRINFQWK